MGRALPVRYQPFCLPVVHSLGITLGIRRITYPNLRWGQREDNTWMTRRLLWITAASRVPSCGQLVVVHNRPLLSTSIVPGASTRPLTCNNGGCPHDPQALLQR